MDTSLKNGLSHVENRHQADIVAPVGRLNFGEGKAMTGYALTSERLELRIGTGESASRTEAHTAQRHLVPPINET